MEAAYDEVEILQEVANHLYSPEWEAAVNEHFVKNPEKVIKGGDNSYVVQLLNSFIYYGQNGKHFCMVFEIMGVTLLDIMKRYSYKGVFR